MRHAFAASVLLLGLLGPQNERPIDRHALVTRHVPVLRHFDPESPLSVGNGEIAFTADVTGLQTFPDGAPDRPAPGFPADGRWVVRSERLRPAP